MLLDEPFGALDAKVRRELREALLRILDDLGLKSSFVTHDHEEAFTLADRVALLSRGRVEQFDTPRQVESSPATDFVKSFLALKKDGPAPTSRPAIPCRGSEVVHGHYLSPVQPPRQGERKISTCREGYSESA